MAPIARESNSQIQPIDPGPTIYGFDNGIASLTTVHGNYSSVQYSGLLSRFFEIRLLSVC